VSEDLCRWEGIFQVEEEGEYTFYSQSDDGSKIYIDTVGDGKEYSLIVDNDGSHDNSQIVSGGVNHTFVCTVARGVRPNDLVCAVGVGL
jgi:hypothetical protein